MEVSYMLDQSQIAATPPTVTDPASPEQPAAPTDDAVAPGTSVEDLDAKWRHRVSQKDKAHAAAEQTLRDENAALQRQLEARTPASGQSGKVGEDTNLRALQEQLAQSNKDIAQERALRAQDARKAKYPALARQVGNAGDSIFASADEATLARLNALADDETDSAPLASTSPRKPAPAPGKSYNDMTKEELETELKRAVEGGAHNLR